jgi:hypothetical protein
MPLTALCKRLSALLQLEIDATAAYEVAIEHAHGRDLQERLLEARNQHRRHIAELRAALEELGYSPEPAHLDLKGRVWKAIAATAGRLSEDGALVSVLGGEQLACRRYVDARRETKAYGAILDRNLEDEKRHLEFLQQALAERHSPG